MCFPSRPERSAPAAGKVLGGIPAHPFRRIFACEILLVKQKRTKSRQVAPKTPLRAQISRGGSKKTSKIDPWKGPKGAPKPLSKKSVETSPNTIIYYTKATSAHPRKQFLSMIFGSETVQKRDLQENFEKEMHKMRKKCPGSAPGRSEGLPGLPQGSQNDIQNR